MCNRLLTITVRFRDDTQFILCVDGTLEYTVIQRLRCSEHMIVDRDINPEMETTLCKADRGRRHFASK